MAGGRIVALWVVAVAALLGAGGGAGADDLFTIGGVRVDRSAASAQQARDAAVAEAERKAFDLLIRRLTDPAQAARLARPADRDLAALVQGFQVEQERASGTRYVATLDISFNGDAVRQLLGAAGIPFVQTAARPLLVVPVYRAGKETLLWEDGNVWRQAWLENPPHTGLVPLVVPQGDVEDLGTLDSGDALAAKPGAFDALIRRYATAGVLLAEASADPDGIALRIAEILGGNRRELLADRVARTAGERDSALYARAVQQIGELVEERYRRDNLVAPGTGGTVTAQIPLDGLDRWLAIRRDLQSVGLVQRLALRALNKNQAVVDIAFNGDEKQLVAALAQTGMRLERVGDNWILRGAAEPRR
jgi:hypothetical protein